MALKLQECCRLVLKLYKRTQIPGSRFIIAVMTCCLQITIFLRIKSLRTLKSWFGACPMELILSDWHKTDISVVTPSVCCKFETIVESRQTTVDYTVHVSFPCIHNLAAYRSVSWILRGIYEEEWSFCWLTHIVTRRAPPYKFITTFLHVLSLFSSVVPLSAVQRHKIED